LAASRDLIVEGTKPLMPVRSATDFTPATPRLRPPIGGHRFHPVRPPVARQTLRIRRGTV